MLYPSGTERKSSSSAEAAGLSSDIRRANTLETLDGYVKHLAPELGDQLVITAIVLKDGVTQDQVSRRYLRARYTLLLLVGMWPSLMSAAACTAGRRALQRSLAVAQFGPHLNTSLPISSSASRRP